MPGCQDYDAVCPILLRTSRRAGNAGFATYHDDHPRQDAGKGDHWRSNMRPRVRLRLVWAALAAGLAGPGNVAFAAEPMDCRVEEPDSVQISWDGPCQTGD